MPTPWPNPAPRMIWRVLAPATEGSASSTRRNIGRVRRRMRGSRTRGDRHVSQQATSVKVAALPDGFRPVSRVKFRVAARKASDVFVECLEAEGVERVFGIPGEETVDLNEALGKSSIEFIPVRHEQGGGYIAGAYGRLTGQAGVILGTLGPGAMNLMTAVADAYLDHVPMVALTGQGDLERMHKESHQHIDIVSVMKPITKW